MQTVSIQIELNNEHSLNMRQDTDIVQNIDDHIEALSISNIIIVLDWLMSEGKETIKSVFINRTSIIKVLH